MIKHKFENINMLSNIIKQQIPLNSENSAEFVPKQMEKQVNDPLKPVGESTQGITFF